MDVSSLLGLSSFAPGGSPAQGHHSKESLTHPHASHSLPLSRHYGSASPTLDSARDARKASLNAIDTAAPQQTKPATHHPSSNNLPGSPNPQPSISPAHNISRRTSWLSNISSKFSSGGGGSAAAPTTFTADPQASPVAAAAAATTTTTATPAPDHTSKSHHSAPPGFLISTLRRLSSTGSNARDAFVRRSSVPPAGLCERVVLNKDELRERCGIPELQGNKLRKVSFCVDVEVAPCHEDVEARKEARRKRREAKDKEKEKLRLLDGISDGGVLEPTVSCLPSMYSEPVAVPNLPDVAVPNVDGAGADDVATPTVAAATEEEGDGEREKPRPRRRIHPKPTTDPMKIYTQCCQLRETIILPEVQDQLKKENCPAVLRSMDLTGFKFQQADAVTFSDFLALVPIKRLILEDCDLTDEIVRMVLSALSAVKPILDGADRPVETRDGDQDETHHRGVIERLSLKRNPKIGREGWKYVSCFVHMSHSLKALDMSKTVLPRPVQTTSSSALLHNKSKEWTGTDPTTLLSKSLGDRLCGHGLEELVLGHCSLSSEQLECLLEGVVKGGTKRLGLEGNELTDDGLAMVGKWMKPANGGIGVCEALDLSNNNVQDHIDILSASINELSPLCALSLSNCNLTATSLSSLLPALATVQHFRWLDLSNNPLLFSSQPDSLALFRRFLPKMQMLRKLDLSNTSMTSDHAIALCEILPEIKTLAFFRVMDNPLIQSGHGKMGEGQLEEGAAVYTALVAAVKVSRSLVRVDVDEPAAGAGDVIHSLSRRLLAYCIRNLEAGATGDDWTINTAAVSRESTELKLAAETFPLGDDDGLMDDEGRTSYEYDEDGVWQDEDNYVVGGTGVVKALGVCLGNKPGLALQRLDTFASLAPGDEMGQERANEMSKALLTRARSIKARIQPALNKSYTGRIKEIHHRRLLFLDDTLHRVINRFEEEYPECREISTIVEPPRLLGSAEELDTPLDEAELDSPSTQNSTTTTNISRPTSRRNSEVSLYSKSLQHEEAQMHKLGQYMMFANSRVVEDEDDDAQKAHKEEIMCEVHGMDGEELKRRIMQVEGGVDEYISKIERRRGSGAAEVVVHNGR